MSLKEQIEKDFKQALKIKDEVVVSTLRMLQAAITNAEIAKMRKELTEEEIQKLIKSEIKKRKEAIEDYKKGGLGDLASKEEKEIKILEKYLPEQLGEEEIRKIVGKVIAEIGPTSPKDFGKVMGQVMKEAGGRADGAVVSRMVREMLESKV